MKVLYDLDVEMQKYPSVLGGCVFGTGCNDDWLAAGFESSEQVKKHRLSFVPPVAEPPVIQEPIRVKLASGEIKTLEMEEYLYAVVPAEMPASWHPEALKAQAVAARSYALWRIAFPRDATFDLYDDARDQVYNLNMIHTQSNKAVNDTRGICLVQKQQ
jgi:peptidoglycan hydrolase-like amidase